VKSLIRYEPEGIIIDLAAPDLGHPDAFAIIERHYRQGSRADRRFNRFNPAFVCLKHEDGSNPGLFMKNIDGEWWAVHYEASGCQPMRVPTRMSDEHKRQAGHAVRRTSRAAQAGVTDLWFTAETGMAPKWLWRVPTVLNRELGIPGEGQSWDIMPRRRSVTAAGLRIVRTAKCTPEHFGQCPYGRGHCGKHHPKPEPWPGLSVDDVAAMFPAAQIVALRFWGVRSPGSRQRDSVFLVPPESAVLYAEVTDGLIAPSDIKRLGTRSSARTTCQNQQPSVPRPGTAGAGALPPTAICGVCQLPLDPVLAAAGETTHALCDPGGLAARWPAKRAGICVICHGSIEIGQLIRQLPGYARSDVRPSFGHDSCLLKISRTRTGADQSSQLLASLRDSSRSSSTATSTWCRIWHQLRCASLSSEDQLDVVMRVYARSGYRRPGASRPAAQWPSAAARPSPGEPPLPARALEPWARAEVG
jgi:hypothetical protein